MQPGLYEQLLSRGLARQLQALPAELRAELRELNRAEAPRVLAMHLAQAFTRALSRLPEEPERIQAINEVLTLLISLTGPAVDPDDLVTDDLRELTAVFPASVVPEKLPERPGIPLTVTELLVNARGEHRVGVEIRRELATADRVDLLCSFLKWSGYRLVREDLERLVRRGGRLRVLTTCYLAATDVEVLEALARLGEVRVSYDTRRTRLHAKAWLFHRDTGFSTGYIGSSNLSSAALLDGLEWNVRIAHADSPRVLEKFQATFDSYWEDAEFEPFDRAHFVRASQREIAAPEPAVYALDIRPYPFQSEILERLSAERELHGQWRNLIVAATGTGKTVIAALDYRRIRRAWPRARLLFVAHREEILDQSLGTFRAVLKDGSFGEKWTGTSRPTQSEHLFASVQKLARVDLSQLRPDHFEVVIVDEFHHAAAPTYRALLEHFQPRLLLGLTATPERADGQSVLSWFGGRPAAELRVWDALERGLLSPFQYFGLHDNTDLTGIAWRGGYDLAELDRLYTGHHARAALVLKQIARHVLDPGKMRALGFCVGVSHARFMAEQFASAGLAAAVVVGETPDEVRRQAVRDLRSGALQILFTVDVFNEGVDLPEVDTVLLLRPTQSATVFLQQLGRGLRLAAGKACLTVLDFIGLARKEFRFDLLYSALLGVPRGQLVEQVEQGFPLLPSGCSVQLDRVAERVVLDNLRRQLKSTRPFLRGELLRVGPAASLGEFLRRSGVELAEVYRGDPPGWLALRREVGFPTPPLPSDRVLRGVARLTHLDDLQLIRYYRRLAFEAGDRRLSMLEAVVSPGERLSFTEGVRAELAEVLAVLEEQVDHLAHPLVEHPDVPLQVHCHYSLAQVQAAFGVGYRIREGVYYDKTSGCDLLFVTLTKSEKHYSPSTMYRDYALSPQLFHWESQSTTRADSPTGLRYRQHRPGGPHALLFVRSERKSQGVTMPYLFLGPAYYESHERERPMAVVWRLKFPVPMQFYRYLRLAA